MWISSLARRRIGVNLVVAVAKPSRKPWASKGYLPRVVDATAGLGRDAFVLAALGCQVQMLERNPVVAALLDDGLRRGYLDAEIGPWLRERLTLLHASSLTALVAIEPRPEVVYLDPMYPHRQKVRWLKRDAGISIIGGGR